MRLTRVCPAAGTLRKFYTYLIMYSFEPFKVDLHEVKDEEKNLVLNLDDDYFKAIDGSEVRSGAVRVTVSVRNTAGTYQIKFHCEGTVKVPCDLCLDDMDQPISTDNRLLAKLGEEYSEDDDLITVERESGVIDLSWLIYEFVALAIPARHVHEPGQCNPEMTVLLKEHEAGTIPGDGQDEETDPRWNELKKLKTIIKD